MGFSDIIAWVVGLIDELISFIGQVLGDLISALNAIFGAIWNAIVDVVNAIVSIFTKAAAFFLHLWNDYIKPAIKGLINLYEKLRARLQAIFGPVLRIIARVRAWFYQYIYPWIKLVQQILSTVRVILSALKLLGVKWAAKLDAEIQKIQSYITTVLQDVVGALNQATTWLNFIADPAGILRRQFLNNSLFNTLAGVSRAATFGKDRYLTASEAQNTHDDKAMLRGGAAVLTRNADGSVTYSDASQRINANLDAAWDSFGPPKR